MSLPPPLDLQGVRVRFGTRTALSDVSLQVGAGEIVGLAGPNGSGKTTLLRAALGLLPLDAGSIRLSGSELGSLSIRERARRAAWMPQSESPLENLPVLDYVLFGRYSHLAPFEREGTVDRQRAREALEAVDLGDRVRSGVLELSGGERQRVLLARALVQEAPLLLLDEPTAHLDVGHQLDLLDRVRRLARERQTAIVIAVHDLNLAARYVERIVVLSHGRRVDDGPPGRVLSPELLREVWGVDAELRTDGTTGQPYLIPQLPRRRREARGSERGPVHVIGGGGTATPLLRALADGGWRVTTGVLPLFDTDTETAQELEVPALVGVPFAPIAPESVEKLRGLLAEARVVVVAPIPVGPANLPNLEEVARLGSGRPPVLLWEPAGWSGRDFAEGAATGVRDRLLANGARSFATLDALLAALDLAFPSAAAT